MVLPMSKSINPKGDTVMLMQRFDFEWRSGSSRTFQFLRCSWWRWLIRSWRRSTSQVFFEFRVAALLPLGKKVEKFHEKLP